MHPMDAIAYVREARDQYRAGGRWEKVWNIIAASVMKRGVREGRLVNPNPEDLNLDVEAEFRPDEVEVGTMLSRIGKVIFDMGEVFIVRQNMCELVDGIWESMPEQAMIQTDLPSEQGIVFFEEPLELGDAYSPGEVKYWGIMWCAANMITAKKILGPNLGNVGTEKTRGVWIFPFNNKNDPGMLEDLVKEGMKRKDAKWRLTSVPSIMLATMKMFEFGKPPNSYISNPYGGVNYMRDPVMGRLVAMWALCRQELPTKERFEPTKKDLHALKRMDMRSMPVTTIMLRRMSGRGNPGTEVEWSHRWLVRGHWRQQWYASEGVHRAIYINPHIKGPEDKPLIVHDKVNILGR